MGVTETHLNSVIDSSLLSVDGYTFISKDRTSSAGGGVGSYIRNELNWERRSDLETPEIEAIWIEIFQNNSSSLLISIIYRPPDSSNHLDANFNDKFNDVLSLGEAENKETKLLGDINCNFLKSTDRRAIKDIFKRYSFKQIINKPTRTTSEAKILIDVITTTREDRILSRLLER